jgi:hypothetical protein
MSEAIIHVTNILFEVCGCVLNGVVLWPKALQCDDASNIFGVYACIVGDDTGTH